MAAIDNSTSSSNEVGSPMASQSYPKNEADREEGNITVDQTISASEFPRAGVYLSWIINEFIPRCGGREKLKGLTTGQVCQQFTKGGTKINESYCQMLKAKGEISAVAESSNVFVSHAFCYQFLDVVDTLKLHLKDELDSVVVWWDLFSMNQHVTQIWTFDWLSLTFKNAIASIGRVIMVMSPWNDPIPYTRGWCVFEAYCAIASSEEAGTRLEIALSERDEKKFLEHMVRKSAASEMDKFTTRVRAEKSACTVSQDKENIFRVIRETIGFSKLDALLFEQYRKWVIGITLRAMKREKKKRLAYMSIAAELYSHQGRYPEASKLYKGCLEQQRIALGPDHPITLATMNCLANQYNMQKDYAAAEPLLKECLERRTRVRGPDHPNTLASMNNLANVYKNTGKYAQAEELYLACLEKRRLVLGFDHVKTLSTINNLGSLYSYYGDFDAAEHWYRESLERRTAVLGKQHPSTLESIENLATLKRYQGKYDDAKPIYEQILHERIAVFGSDHPKTLLSASNLAGVLAELQEFDLAEAMHKDCVERAKAAHGPDNPNTLTLMHNLADMYSKRRDYNAAAPLHDECFRRRESILGSMHPDTLSSMESLADIHKNESDYDSAERMTMECLQKRKEIFSEDHPKTLESISNLAILFSEQDGKEEEAESLFVSCLAQQQGLLGDIHKSTRDTINGLASLYEKQGKLDEADRLKKGTSPEKESQRLSPTPLDFQTSNSSFSSLSDDWCTVQRSSTRRGKCFDTSNRKPTTTKGRPMSEAGNRKARGGYANSGRGNNRGGPDASDKSGRTGTARGGRGRGRHNSGQGGRGSTGGKGNNTGGRGGHNSRQGGLRGGDTSSGARGRGRASGGHNSRQGGRNSGRTGNASRGRGRGRTR